MKVKNRLALILAEKDLREADLARKTGMAQSYINRIKNSHISPKVGTALRICRALGVSVEEAFPGDR